MKLNVCIPMLLATIILSSCQANNSNENEAELIGDKWRLTYYLNSKGLSVVITTPNSLQNDYWLEFDENGTVSAQDACNTCSGKYEIIDDNTFSLSDYSCTEIACSESSFLFLWDDHYSYSTEGDVLTITELTPTPGIQYTFIVVKDNQ